jgi:hypothetical protein
MAKVVKLRTACTPDERMRQRRLRRARERRREREEERTRVPRFMRRMVSHIIFDFECVNDNHSERCTRQGGRR